MSSSVSPPPSGSVTSPRFWSATEPIPVSCGVGAQLVAVVAAATPRWSAGARWSRLPENGDSIVVCTDFPTRIASQRSVVLAFSDARGLDTHCVRIPTRAHVDFTWPAPGPLGQGRMNRSTALAKPSSSFIVVIRRAARLTSSLALPIAMLSPDWANMRTSLGMSPIVAISSGAMS
jgi:hypothetical protein